MTREEAIEIIRNYDVNGCGYCHQGGNEIEEAFEMAIEALTAEPCEDCVSRLAARNCITFNEVRYRMIEDFDRLPSVQPKPQESEDKK